MFEAKLIATRFVSSVIALELVFEAGVVMSLGLRDVGTYGWKFPDAARHCSRIINDVQLSLSTFEATQEEPCIEPKEKYKFNKITKSVSPHS